MSHTQTAIDTFVNDIVNSYTGQSISYYGTYQNECTSPAKYYVDKITGAAGAAPYMVNNRADGWGVSFPSQFVPFFTLEGYQPGKVYPRGTILMWNSPHIAIVLHSDGSNNIQVFEQNADPEGSVCGTKNRVVNNQYHTCTYALLPTLTVDAPTPPASTYEVTDNYPNGKQITLNKQPTNLWGMNYADPGGLPPIEVHNQGEIWTVTNKVHHRNGYDYYRREGQVDGFNVLDCDDYTPPPTPYTPPAAPERAVLAEKYQLVVDLPSYDNALSSLSNGNQTGNLPAGSYYVWATDGLAKKLGTSNMTEPTGGWVNTGNNHVPVAVPKPAEVISPTPVVTVPVSTPAASVTTDSGATVMASFQWFYANHASYDYKASKDLVVYDQVHFGKEKKIAKGKTVPTYGTFEKNGQLYVRPMLPSDKQGYYYYGVPVEDVDTGAPYLNGDFNTADKVLYGFEYWYDKHYKTIDGIFRPLKSAISKLKKK